jgi:hypothetical protein
MHVSAVKKERLIREIFKPWRRGIKKYFPTYCIDGVLFRSKYHGMSSKTLFREFKDSPSLEELSPNDFWFLDHHSSMPTKKQIRIQKKRSDRWALQREKRVKAIKRVLKEQRKERRRLREQLNEKQTKKTGKRKK